MQLRSAIGVFASCIAPVVLAACSLGVDWGALRASAGSDAGPDAASGAGADAAQAASDSGAQTDASSVGASVPCAMRTAPFLFCADFDDVLTVGQGWTYTVVDAPGGAWELDRSIARSPPASARATVPVGSSTQGVQLGYEKPGAFAAATLSVDVRFDESDLGPIGLSGFVQLYVGDAPIQVQIGPAGAMHLAGNILGVDAAIAPSDVPAPRTWFRVSLHREPGKASVAFDGKTVASATVKATSPGRIAAIIGGVWAPASGAGYHAQFDNVLVTSP